MTMYISAGDPDGYHRLSFSNEALYVSIMDIESVFLYAIERNGDIEIHSIEFKNNKKAFISMRRTGVKVIPIDIRIDENICYTFVNGYLSLWMSREARPSVE